MLVEDENFAIATKAEIRHPTRDPDLAQKHATRGPDMNTIRASRIYIAVDVTLDTVWDRGICESEKPAIDQEWLAMNHCDFKRVSAACIVSNDMSDAQHGLSLT